MTSKTSVGMEELERRLRGGDVQALAELFSREHERLWRIIHFRLAEPLRGRLEPEDVLQEAFLAARQRLGHYVESSATSPFIWLRMIVNQTLVDLHRQHLGAQRRDAAREVSLDGTPYAQATSASVAIQLVGAFTSPSGAAARADVLTLVQTAIEQMDPIDREVLALRHFEELTNSEVAETLGIEQKAASIRYVRALRRLKEILARMPELQA
ncbi:MAG TPA: sigma-70 family RNA polymerase sigma factor [Candidatus Paceibacterota bacterium]|nr:sigma-70 family RNA polymerase sigma factor [Verrucomicrobiota bacterium]HRY52210.1 sigma-70 family RNA polymerase sigma factor [Candidatus Paceibacterota bacterium]